MWVCLQSDTLYSAYYVIHQNYLISCFESQHKYEGYVSCHTFAYRHTYLCFCYTNCWNNTRTVGTILRVLLFKWVWFSLPLINKGINMFILNKPCFNQFLTIMIVHGSLTFNFAKKKLSKYTCNFVFSPMFAVGSMIPTVYKSYSLFYSNFVNRIPTNIFYLFVCSKMCMYLFHFTFS